MSSSSNSRLKKIKKECQKLYDLKEKSTAYYDRADRISERVYELKLHDILDPDSLRASLLRIFRKNIFTISREEFNNYVEDHLKRVQYHFYFHIIEPEGFPDNCRIGHGVLMSYELLPDAVKAVAKSLARGEIPEHQPHRDIMEKLMKGKLIIGDPHIGYWLKIDTLAISSIIHFRNAFNFAEESLDILRIVTPTAKINLPQFAIQHKSNEERAFVACTISFSRYPYAPRKEQLIRRLGKICINPKSDLEKRLKDALHFFRIAEYHSPNHQKLFFYVAAMERLILSRELNLAHKFSERGAILLENDVETRLQCSEKLGKLYGKRSAIAHGEKTDYDFHLTQRGKSYLFRMIMKILYLIDSKRLQRVTPKRTRRGNSLEEYLDEIIFSS